MPRKPFALALALAVGREAFQIAAPRHFSLQATGQLARVSPRAVRPVRTASKRPVSISAGSAAGPLASACSSSLSRTRSAWGWFAAAGVVGACIRKRGVVMLSTGLRSINALTLCTRDMEKSCAFYAKLGLTKE